MKKYTGIEKIDTVIPKGIHAIGRRFEQMYRSRYALHHWKKIVGESVAKNSRTVAVENNKLLLYVPDATWRNEIKMFEADIIQKFNNFAGERVIKEILFVNRRPTNEMINLPANVAQRKKTEKVILSTEEKNFINDICKKTSDKDLQKKLRKLIGEHKKLNKKREIENWQKCEKCGEICPPPYKKCLKCRSAEQAEKRRIIRRYLVLNPWARYAEINEYIKCEPEDVNEERSSLVQKWAAQIKIDEGGTLRAKKLVMLYRCLPPEQINEAVIGETLYRLRNDLAKDGTFKPVKRYDFVKKRKN